MRNLLTRGASHAYLLGMTTSMARKATPDPDRTLCDALAAELRAEAARRRLSQRDMATLMGKPRGWVERRWNGEKRIDADDMEAISAFFGWTPTAYLNRAEILRGTMQPPTVAKLESNLCPDQRASPTTSRRVRAGGRPSVTGSSRPASYPTSRVKPRR
jgi:hypothetical protein